MTSPITKPKKSRAARAPEPVPASVKTRDWCCGTPINGPHEPGCAYEPTGPIDYDGPVEVVAEVPEPPAPTPDEGSVPAVSSVSEDRPYGFTKPTEFDLDLPSGGKVKVRKLRMMQIVDMGIVDMFDSFGPELLKGINEDNRDEVLAAAELEVIRDPQKRAKVFGPLHTIIVAAVLCPTVVADGPSTDTQMNVDEIDLEDKWQIFAAVMPDEMQNAALEAQRTALKRVHRS